MPKGMAVTRMIPMNRKPPNTCSTAGTGGWKPICAKEAASRSSPTPPSPKPSAAAPQASTSPMAMATSPAGMLRG